MDVVAFPRKQHNFSNLTYFISINEYKKEIYKNYLLKILFS